MKKRRSIESILSTGPQNKKEMRRVSDHVMSVFMSDKERELTRKRYDEYNASATLAYTLLAEAQQKIENEKVKRAISERKSYIIEKYGSLDAYTAVLDAQKTKCIRCKAETTVCRDRERYDAFIECLSCSVEFTKWAYGGGSDDMFFAAGFTGRF